MKEQGSSPRLPVKEKRRGAGGRGCGAGGGRGGGGGEEMDWIHNRN